MVKKLLLLLVSAVLLVAIWPHLSPARAQDDDLGTTLRTTLDRLRNLQSAGADLSTVEPYLLNMQRATRAGDHRIAEQYLLDLQDHLSQLIVLPQAQREPIWIVVHADQTGQEIPRLAGSVTVNADADSPELNRFLKEIGPGLTQFDLSLATLNKARDNYPWSQKEDALSQAMAAVKTEDARLLLHLKDIPGFLAADVETASGPIQKEQLPVWSEIVKEVVSHFNRSAETRLDYVQSLGRPNTGSHWIDPEHPERILPDNVLDYAAYYRATAEGALDADRLIRIGAGSFEIEARHQTWIQQFLKQVDADKTQLDFFGFYAGGPNFGTWDLGGKDTSAALADTESRDAELLVTQWAGPLGLQLPGEVRSSHAGSAFAVAAFQRLLDTKTRHTATYLVETEDHKPGLLTMNDGAVVPTSMYEGFLLFSKLHGRRRIPIKQTEPRVQQIAASNSREVLVLISYHEPFQWNLDTYEYEVPDWEQYINIMVKLDGLPFDEFEVELFRIDAEHPTLNRSEVDPGIQPIHKESGRGTAYRRELHLPIYGTLLLRLKAAD